MDVRSVIAQIVEKAHSAEDAVKLKQGVFESLRSLVPHDLSCWVLASAADTGSPCLWAASGRVRVHLETQYISHQRRYHAELAESGALAKGRATGTGIDTELLTQTERDRHSVYREVLGPVQAHSILFCAIPFREHSFSALLIGRLDRSPPFTRIDLDRVRQLRAILGLIESAFLTASGSAGIPAQRPQVDFGFSRRESQVARLIAGGLANKEIAALLGTSPDTIRKQSIRIYQKAEVSSRTQLARRLSGHQWEPETGAGAARS